MDDDESQAATSDNDNDQENDIDEAMEDVDEDADLENEEENEENEEDEDQEDGADNAEESPIHPQSRAQRTIGKSESSARIHINKMSSDGRQDIDINSKDPVSKDPKQCHSAIHTPHSRETGVAFRPLIRPEVLSASTYDIVPTIASPHSTSINAVTATLDMRWVFSGGSDGWIRKFSWVETANGKSMLTVAQRHPFVDSVTKAGVLMSYWENEETMDGINNTQTSDEGPSLSPVYSLAVQHQALWLLSGTELGAINLQSVRHEEGKRITSLREHTSAVSIMVLSQDERSFLSGSWDKTILDWDLNIGKPKRSFMGIGSQISAIELRPLSSLPVPRDFAEKPTSDGYSTASGVNERIRRASTSIGVKELENKGGTDDPPLSPSDSLFEDSLFGDDTGTGVGVGFDQDGSFEFSGALSSDLGESIRAEETSGKALNSELHSMGSNLNETKPLEEEQGERNSTQRPEDINLPHSDDSFVSPIQNTYPENEPEPTSESTFLDAAIDGTLRIWDRRQPNPIAKIVPQRAIPPWCMHACWSCDGNFIYAGRRNGIVEEYSMHKGLKGPQRTLRFPSGSGPVSAVRAMPNGKHLICASFDILRLYDLRDEESSKHSKVPFLIVPGHRTGVVSQLFIDPTCSFMISAGGTRGWEGNSTEVLLGYEIGIGH